MKELYNIKRIAFSILIVATIACCKDKNYSLDKHDFDSKLAMLLDLINDNRQRLDRVGLAQYSPVLSYTYDIKIYIFRDMNILDSLYQDSGKNTLKMEDLKYNFKNIDLFRLENLKQKITKLYTANRVSEDVLIKKIFNGFEKRYNEIYSTYSANGNIDIFTAKKYRLDVIYLMLSKLLNTTRGKRTGSNYAFYPRIDYNDVDIENGAVTTIKVGLGVEPLSFDFKSDLVSILIDNQEIRFDSTLNKQEVNLDKSRRIGDSLNLQLKIQNPLTGMTSTVEKSYIIK